MTDQYYDFSGRDYAAAYQRLLDILREEVPELSDLNHSDAGVSLIRLDARTADQLAFYLDEAFNEGFITLARYKQSLIDLAMLTGYPPKLASAASTTITLGRFEGYEGYVHIPAQTIFTRGDGLGYVTQNAVQIKDVENSVTVDVLQGELVTLTIKPEEFAVTDLSGFPKVNIGRSVAAGTVRVSHGDPVETWTEVDSFWRSQESANDFSLELWADPYNGELDTVFLVLMHVPDVSVTVSFLRTAEADGNCGYGKITRVPATLLAQCTCTNEKPATGGAPAEGIESLRSRIPAVTRTQRRGVTLPDYEALIVSIPGVRHCQAIDRNEDSFCPYSYVKLYVVPEGGGPMSDYLRERIFEQCCSWGHLGRWRKRYIVLDATEVPVPVTARLGIAAGHKVEVEEPIVNQAMADLLSVDNQEIGGALAYGDIVLALDRLGGVSWSVVTSPVVATVAGQGEILTLGNVSWSWET